MNGNSAYFLFVDESSLGNSKTCWWIDGWLVLGRVLFRNKQQTTKLTRVPGACLCLSTRSCSFPLISFHVIIQTNITATTISEWCTCNHQYTSCNLFTDRGSKSTSIDMPLSLLSRSWLNRCRYGTNKLLRRLGQTTDDKKAISLFITQLTRSLTKGHRQILFTILQETPHPIY